MFTESDYDFMARRGNHPATVEQQIKYFVDGFPFLNVIRAASLTDGINRLTEAQVTELADLYQNKLGELQVIKFVPASGAASRMFKNLFSALEKFTPEKFDELMAETAADSAGVFLKNVESLALAPALNEVLAAKGTSIAEAMANRRPDLILAALLNEDGLNYGNLPKGLLLFHKHPEGMRTPLEEHLVEAAYYARNNQNKAYLHFTVSPEHRSKFEWKLGEVIHHYQTKFGIEFIVSFSEQKPSTDTIAVDLNNQPFRNDDGSLLFRPGGHGALIENLNDLDADVVFIKNIDNVVCDSFKAETFLYKKALGGALIQLRDKIFEFLHRLDAEGAHSGLLGDIDYFISTRLSIKFPDYYFNLTNPDKADYLRQKLNRPIRVCGMVLNEGEPGGGPFIARNSDGSAALQVVESSQIDMGNAEQVAILKNSTHFNPVDLVCYTRDYKGNKFDLTQYVDPLTGFITKKSKSGRDLKALELPGLWNGAMADWNTMFVETPIGTFNPVKTVNDLFRPPHAANE